MDLSEEYHIEVEAWDVRCDEKSNLSQTYKR
jgi:hypothetical protein